MTTPLLSVRNVVQEFTARGHGGVKGGVVHAVSDVSFDLAAGETLGVVGETGSGKSTLARSILQAPRPKSGEVHFQGQDLVRRRRRELTEARRQLQMVFQDPYGSLNPRWRVSEIVEEPLAGYRVGNRRARVRQLLDLVGLDPGTPRSPPATRSSSSPPRTPRSPRSRWPGSPSTRASRPACSTSSPATDPKRAPRFPRIPASAA
ncbi:ABC-type glutathione transport system ATPase component [Amycolatopsis bartoniae]|uniref:ABC transporter domain-containing protein n=1 Tax=Amycolatopsis bartoniae TaxID=941986 RepID=A0A8H9IZ36_9PSEU|nr:ABC-type glutathione transport system ATPase component [Amycolatopsis bartoniae]GHF49705.1 hypothetical protein GCM10017566_23360 [Amycolatopsis bartoniae]